MMEMNGLRINVCWFPHALLFLVVVLSLLPCIWCVDGDDYSQTSNPAVLPLVTDLIYRRLSNLSTILTNDIKKNLHFCIKNVCVIPISLMKFYAFYRSLLIFDP